MRVLILGGSAFFGRRIVEKLAELGHETWVFNRGNLNSGLPTQGILRGDRGNATDLKKAAENGPWDLIIDNLAYRARDVELAAPLFSRTTRYFLTSSIAVYRYHSDVPTLPYRENAVDYSARPKDEVPGDPHWDYARGKLEAEQALLNSSCGSWTIFRPTIILGPRDPSGRTFWYVARLAKNRNIELPHGGLNVFSLAYYDDVASAYVTAAMSQASENQIFNLAHTEILTLRDYVFLWRDRIGSKSVVSDVITDQVEQVGGPFAMTRTWIPSLDNARRALGFVPTPLADTMEPLWSHYQTHSKTIDPKIGI